MTFRCDHLPHHMNKGKQAKIHALLKVWREAAGLVAREQWTLFHQTGRFNKLFDAATEHRKASAEVRRPLVRLLAARGGRDVVGEDTALAERIEKLKRDGKRYKPPVAKAASGFVDGHADIRERLGAARLQMVRYQYVGMADSWLSNRKNDFRSAVFGSTVDECTRHQLLTVNAWNAWFCLDKPVRMKDTDEVVLPHVRRLARAIMRHAFRRNRKPGTRRIGMVIDQRAITVLPPTQARSFDMWAEVATLERRGKAFKTVQVPLKSYEHHDQRPGERKTTVQVSERDGRLTFGLMTDMAEPFKQLTADYQPKTECLSLDWGMRTLFASDKGDLFGRCFIDNLRRLDRAMVRYMRKAQRLGLKPKQFAPYIRVVERMRGYVKTMIGMALNRAVAVHRPAVITVEKLNFRSPELSRKMNRLMTNAGRSIVAHKLQDLTERFGIEVLDLNPAYTSQQCACGYVDKRNRSGDEFACRWCGRRSHADVQAARNQGVRRSDPFFANARRKADILAELVRRFSERFTGARGGPGDPRWQNPYFKDHPPQVSMSESATQHLVSAEAA